MRCSIDANIMTPLAFVHGPCNVDTERCRLQSSCLLRSPDRRRLGFAAMEETHNFNQLRTDPPSPRTGYQTIQFQSRPSVTIHRLQPSPQRPPSSTTWNPIPQQHWTGSVLPANCNTIPSPPADDVHNCNSTLATRADKQTATPRDNSASDGNTDPCTAASPCTVRV